MSIDDTGSALWSLKKNPLPLLLATKAMGLVAAELPDEARAPFEALSDRLASWRPEGEFDSKAVYDGEFKACLSLHATYEPAARMQPTLNGAYVQMAGLLKVMPKNLPNEIYEVTEAHFQQHMRAAARAGRLPIAQLDARLRFLLEHAKKPWAELVARIERMTWVRSAPWGKLDKRLRALASLADLGANASWTEIGGKSALRIELEGTARVAVLTSDELAALRVVVPALPDFVEGP